MTSRLSAEGRLFLENAGKEIGRGVPARRCAELLSVASRHARRHQALSPTSADIAAANVLVNGWNPERWNLLETLRAALLFSRGDLAHAEFAAAYEQCFKYADEGEACALYRVLPLLPGGERFAWRAGEGCRSNMRTLFEAVACDSPYPVKHFDDTAWHQLVLKSIFIEAPLFRVWGVDTRISPALAHSALDLAEERRSAGRPVQPQLWMCLGKHVDERALKSLRHELTTATPLAGRRAALLALARAGELARVDAWFGSVPSELQPTLAQARSGDIGQAAFGRLE